MGQILIRNVPDEDIATLKAHARERQSSLEAEARAALRAVAERLRSAPEFWRRADEMRARTVDRPQSDSAELRKVGRRG